MLLWWSINSVIISIVINYVTLINYRQNGKKYSVVTNNTLRDVLTDATATDAYPRRSSVNHNSNIQLMENMERKTRQNSFLIGLSYYEFRLIGSKGSYYNVGIDWKRN